MEKTKGKFEVFSAQGGPASGGDSFKKYLLPPIEDIESKPPKKFVIIGLSDCDLEAIIQLDEIMTRPVRDSLYWQRREQAIIVGSDDKNAKKFVEDYKEFLEETMEALLPLGSVASKWADWTKSMRQLLLDSELLANAVEWSHDHKIWDDLAIRCLGCGICTYVCPLCYCFSMEDSVGFDGVCKRCKKWDACTLPNFSKIAGGHDFRPSIKERYYNWFYHKFVRAYKEYGKSQCVGCGRCKSQCPAGIDIYEVLKIILEDYGKYLSAAKN